MGKGRKKREQQGQGKRLASVLWHQMSVKNHYPSQVKSYISSLNFGRYYLQYVLATIPFDHTCFEVIEALTLPCT